ncbi:MAG: sugar ABC transporter ATP-binding protein [Firmicutes bacterium]|nr:sugar ABC transporter ATP-binding protein [Bacillota bacterium]
MPEKRGPLDEEQAPLLEVRGVTKRFPGVLALDQVRFDLRAGEIHALVGENGAGKSTLMKILAGAYRPDAGQILLQGQPVALTSPRQAADLGISIIYQEFTLLPALSVAENIFLSHLPGQGRYGWLNRREMLQAARHLLDRVGLDVDPAVPVRRLRVAQQQLVEVAKALSRQARVLIMDEPTAALT